MDKLTILDCKRELQKRNASTEGSKAEILTRLRLLLEEEGTNIEERF